MTKTRANLKRSYLLMKLHFQFQTEKQSRKDCDCVRVRRVNCAHLGRQSDHILSPFPFHTRSNATRARPPLQSTKAFCSRNSAESSLMITLCFFFCIISIRGRRCSVHHHNTIAVRCLLLAHLKKRRATNIR